MFRAPFASMRLAPSYVKHGIVIQTMIGGLLMGAFITQLVLIGIVFISGALSFILFIRHILNRSAEKTDQLDEINKKLDKIILLLKHKNQ